jgi:hypothetical protein
MAINRHQDDLPETVLGYEVDLCHICVYDARRAQADIAAMDVEEVWKSFGRRSEDLNATAIAFVPTRVPFPADFQVGGLHDLHANPLL